MYDIIHKKCVNAYNNEQKHKAMADISMCKGDNCKLKEKCYRFTATREEIWQSYFLKPPIDDEGNCEYYWDNESTKNK